MGPIRLETSHVSTETPDQQWVRKKAPRWVAAFSLLLVLPATTIAQKRLLKATKKSDVAVAAEELKKLRDSGRRPNTAGLQALDLAIDSGNTEILRLWLDSDAYPDHRILHRAVKEGQWGMAEFIVGRGVNASQETVELALENGESAEHLSSLFSSSTEDNGKHLLTVLQLERVDIAHELIDMGADVNYQDPGYLVEVEVLTNGYSIDQRHDLRGMSVVARAVQLGNLPLTRRLLEEGADPNVSVIVSTVQLPGFGHDRALLAEQARTGQVVLEQGGGRRVIMQGSKTTLVGYEAPQELIEIEGNQISTPLIMAIVSKKTSPTDRLAFVDLLLSHGADPYATDQRGLTPIMHADERGLAEVRQLLSKHVD